MSTINPCLKFNGNTDKAFSFYKSVFGGEFSALMYVKDMPEAHTLPPNEQNKIIHIALPIKKDQVLMAYDALPSTGRKLMEGNNFHLVLNPESEAEADQLFKKLSSGGKVTMPLKKTFWNAYFGMLEDKFGIQWMINYAYDKKRSV
jgi:PhnB protein